MRVQTVAAGVALLVLALVAGFVALRALGTAGAAAGSGAPTAALAAPRFLEESQAAGLAHAYQGGFEFYVGGGLATFDCNGDALPELYFAGGTAPSALFVNRSELGGRLRFAKTPGAATDLGAVTGAYPLDVDGDGHVDLAVLRRGENALLRGLGKCVFERANELWGFDGGDDWSTAFSAKWDRGSSWPTLAIGNYLEPDRPAGQ